jgi:hypothetical protein
MTEVNSELTAWQKALRDAAMTRLQRVDEAMADLYQKLSLSPEQQEWLLQARAKGDLPAVAKFQELEQNIAKRLVNVRQMLRRQVQLGGELIEEAILAEPMVTPAAPAMMIGKLAQVTGSFVEGGRGLALQLVQSYIQGYGCMPRNIESFLGLLEGVLTSTIPVIIDSIAEQLDGWEDPQVMLDADRRAQMTALVEKLQKRYTIMGTLWKEVRGDNPDPADATKKMLELNMRIAAAFEALKRPKQGMTTDQLAEQLKAMSEQTGIPMEKLTAMYDAQMAAYAANKDPHTDQPAPKPEEEKQPG